MEIANLEKHNLRLRQAGVEDKLAITRLLQRSPYQHVHIDWKLPVDWLGTPGFVLIETGPGHPEGEGQLLACLAVGADPPPAAWVRVAAVSEAVARSTPGAAALLQALLQAVRPALLEEGVTQLGWLPQEQWPERWLRALGFERTEQVETLVKEGLAQPPGVDYNGRVEVREVNAGDLQRLAAIEEAAFSPLWRHSVDELARAWRRALLFEVACLNGEVVGFSYSVPGDARDAAHLVRMTVAPAAQGQGVGSALLVASLAGYRRQGIRRVSLNTQQHNVASKRLYGKFGFEPAGYALPVWSLEL